MKKYYPYNVKDLLTDYFPNDTLTKMRAINTDKNIDANHKLEVAWAYAHQHMLGYFLQDVFLKETVLCDDYIAYITCQGATEYVYLVFLCLEEEYSSNYINSFYLNHKYAMQLSLQWEKKGYKPIIAKATVFAENHPNGKLYFKTHMDSVNFVTVAEVSGKYILIKESQPFWNHITNSLYSAITSGLMSEYESVFTEDASIVQLSHRGRIDSKYNTLATSIENIKAYFENHLWPELCFIKKKKSFYYDVYLTQNNKYYEIYVNSTNRISNLAEYKISDTDSVISVPSHIFPDFVPMPEPVSVRALDVTAIHGYGIQIAFSSGLIKNYYLHSFDTFDIPKEVFVDEYLFTENTLHSVRYIHDHHREGVIFDNGYYIPLHTLYYHSNVQLIPEKLDHIVINTPTKTLQGMYRLPLKVHTSSIFTSFKAPSNDLLYGPAFAIIDEYGNRLNDYSGLHIDSKNKYNIYLTQSESTGKIGYMKKDGTCLIPPVLDEGGSFEDNPCVTIKLKGKQCLLNCNGEIIPFEHKIDTDSYYADMCEFSVKKHEGNVTYPDDRYFDSLSPGLWGFIDENGKVVIEPQYVFTAGFSYFIDRAPVAKIVGDETLWGLIDIEGNETIPCVYYNIGLTANDNYFAFQPTKNGNYGIMDLDGNVIIKPCFNYIKDYNPDRQLLIAGNDYKEYGVVQLKDNKTIIPFEYEYIEFENEHIYCENYGEIRCFDYEGNPIEEPPHKSEHGENYFYWKDGKCGVTDSLGNVVVPFIFDNSSHVDYYEQGYVVTGAKGNYGLVTLDGKEILPQKYSDITIKDGFIIARIQTRGNWTVRDELYLEDGTLILDGIYRKVSIKNNTLSLETPAGQEFYQIKTNKE